MPQEQPFSTAFQAIPVASGRTAVKPRSRGLTSLLDYGIGIGAQRDLLELAAHVIDIAKLATGTARVYTEKVLTAKIETYRQFDVEVLMGGQFAEYTFATGGMSSCDALFAEAKRVGFSKVEVSDTCRPFGAATRQALIAQARSHGLAVVCEIGQLERVSNDDQLYAEIATAMTLDVELVIVEGSELVNEHGPRSGLIERIRAGLDTDRLLFELPGPGIGGASQEQVEMMKCLLIRTVGPDVNIGNVSADEIVQTEVVRLGIEDSASWSSSTD